MDDEAMETMQEIVGSVHEMRLWRIVLAYLRGGLFLDLAGRFPWDAPLGPQGGFAYGHLARLLVLPRHVCANAAPKNTEEEEEPAAPAL